MTEVYGSVVLVAAFSAFLRSAENASKVSCLGCVVAGCVGDSSIFSRGTGEARILRRKGVTKRGERAKASGRDRFEGCRVAQEGAQEGTKRQGVTDSEVGEGKRAKLCAVTPRVA